jgi:hypothetical protein
MYLYIRDERERLHGRLHIFGRRAFGSEYTQLTRHRDTQGTDALPATLFFFRPHHGCEHFVSRFQL